MKKILFIISFALIFVANSMAQETLTLEKCLQIGIDNNLSLRTKRKDMKKGELGISENRAKLLPQINAFANFNDNFNPPESVTDGSSFGNPYNVTHTLQYSANAGFQLQLPLYNQTLYTSMRLTRTLDEISKLQYEKALEELIVQISKMYYLGQTTTEQIKLLEDNIHRLNELKSITVAFFDNGMVMDIDVKRVNINLENLKVQYDNAQAMLTQQLNMLKYIIDYPIENEIALSPISTEKISNVKLSGLSEELPDIKLVNQQFELVKSQLKMVKNGYIPSLTLTGNWAYATFTDKASHWFHSHPSNKWHCSYGLGLSVRIPIFDGLDKKYKTKKANIDLANAKLNQENLRKSLETQYMNATNDLMNNQRNFHKQKDNYILAEEVYTVTTERYKEGITSMVEVLQDEMRMSEAQNNYISAHYNYQVANLTLLKLTGRLDTLRQ